MARFQRNFRRSSGSRPNRAWDGFTSSVYSTLAASTSVIVAGFISTVGDLTILRTVGQMSVTSDQAAGLEDQIGALGMILVSNAAFSVGITAMPDPIADQSDDGWWMYQSFSQQGDQSLGSSLPRTYPFDSKAKRTVEGEGQTLAVIVSNASASHGIRFSMNFRILTQIRGTR